MRFEQQVCSLYLAKRLKELGVKQESYFYWTDGTKEIEPHVYHYDPKNMIVQDNFYSAFAVAELGELLPAKISEKTILTEREHTANMFYMVYDDDDSDCDGTNPDTCIKRKWVCEMGKHTTRDIKEADASVKMLIYLLENNLMK